MYALSLSAEGDGCWCVLPDPGIAAAALGASASGTPPGTAPAEALHTFTLDSGASRCFFRDSTTLTPLHAPIPVRLADPSGGPVVASSSTILPCPAVPSGSLSGLHLPSFSTNLVSTAALQDAMVTTTTPGGQRVSICTCTQTGRHLATFTRRPGSRLYTLATEPPQVAASAQTLLWHHRLGHPSLPCLRDMHSRLLVSGLPMSLPPLSPSPAPPCLPCVEGRQRAAPHSSSFSPTTAPLQTLHMDVWGPACVSGQGCERYFLLVVDDYTRYTTVFPLRSKGEVSAVLIPWIHTVRLQLRTRFGQELPVLRLHSDKGGEFSSDLLWDFCRGEGIIQSQGSGDAAEKRNEPPPSKIEALDGSNYEEWSGRMRSAFKRYKLLKLVMGEEKMLEERDARDRWIEKSAVLYDLILQLVNNDMFQHIKDLVELDDSGPKAWKLLRDVIQPNTLPMVIVLEKELAALSMRPGDDVKPVLDKVNDTYARMAAAGSKVTQMQQCTKIISVLDNSWDNLIPTLNTQQDQWTPEWLRQQILQEDFRRRHTGGGAANKTAEGYGAAGGSRGRGGGRGRGRGRGFGRGRGRGDYNEGHRSSGGRGSTRMEGACWYCKMAGHPWFKCFSRPEGWAPPGMKLPSGERARGGAVQGSGAQGSGVQGKANPGMFLMVEDVKGSEGDVGSVGKVVMHPLTHWVIDSGCTSHMTPRADLLDEVKPRGKIMFVAAASGAFLPVIGVGNAKEMGANGGLVGLGNVLLVEGLSANLLSVRRLQKSKAKVTFGPTSCRANLGKLLLWDLEEKSSCIKDLWQLPIIPWNGKPPATAAAAATAKATTAGEETAPTDGALDAVKKVQQSQQPHGEVLAGVDATAAWAKASSGNGAADWETWHERLCHINIPMLQKLVKDGSLKGLEVKGVAKEIGSCPTCLETKFKKFPFSSGMGPTKAPLALVHMDVVGPTRAPSLSSRRNFLTIVDDHKRAVWVYPLKTKGEVAVAVLKEWMPRAQRESGHKVKVIRTDNGGGFIGADFEAVLKKKGIQHQLTVLYNPQQNGVAERFNRTLQEGARTLLGRAGLPDPFWVTALRQVALYGCMVVFHVPKEKRGKLEASGRWGVHLGLAKDHKGWLIWDLTRQQLTVSRDVKFLESLYYKEWKQQQQKLPTTPLIIEADEVQRPSGQVQVTVSEEEISRVTEDGGEPEVEEQQQQQQQQQDAPQGAARLADRPRRDVRPPNRLTYPSFGKPKVVRAGSVAEQCDDDKIAHCYWAGVPEPKTLAEALSGPDAEKWKQSVKEEYDSLLENETWELCELPPGKKAISSKLIFRHKYGPDGELTRYKSSFVAKGFQQTKGKDFDEIFAPEGKGTTLRVMLGMAANRGWKIKQMDITTAFLNGIILEELYMLQPEGLDDGSGRVCRLKKAIYGLKQAPRAWYHKLEETLLAGGFKKSECDHSLFLLQEKKHFLMLLVYVDDILLFSESAAMIERVEEMLEMQFKCSKMGDVKYYLGMHVERDLDKGVLRLHQRKYCEGLAEKYGLQDGGKPATPLPSGFTVEPCADEEVVGESDRKLFHSMGGALNYAANHTRPDIAFATSRLASVVSRPSHEQLEAAKRLVRNVSATASVGLEYSAVRQRLQRGAADLSKGEMLLTCYTDASFISVKADGTSIGGYVCLFGGGAVSWRSKKQNEVGLSSCETEYMALHHGAKEVVWLRRLLEEIEVCQKEPTAIFCDNESAVKLAKNACLHGLTKHIRPKWHWVRRLLDKEVRLEIVKTHQQAADILTKRLAENEHWKGMKLAGMSVH
ncbi:unnamed protein product [Closterium sp. NIES-54]